MVEINNKWENLEIRVSLGQLGEVTKVKSYDLEYLWEIRNTVYTLSNRVFPHPDTATRYVIMAEAGVQRLVHIIDVREDQHHWTGSPLQKVSCFRQDNGSYDIYDPENPESNL